MPIRCSGRLFIPSSVEGLRRALVDCGGRHAAFTVLASPSRFLRPRLTELRCHPEGIHQSLPLSEAEGMPEGPQPPESATKSAAQTYGRYTAFAVSVSQ